MTGRDLHNLLVVSAACVSCLSYVILRRDAVSWDVFDLVMCFFPTMVALTVSGNCVVARMSKFALNVIKKRKYG